MSLIAAPAALASPAGSRVAPFGHWQDADTDLTAIIKGLRRSDPQKVADAILAAFTLVGVPVYASEGDAEPISPVRGTQLPIAVSLTQVRAMATELAADGGLLGSELDELIGEPEEGMAETSLLLAAWVRSMDTVAAQLASGVMGKQNWKRYAELPYPLFVQTLFNADVCQASMEEADAAVISRRNLLASVGPIDHRPASAFVTVCGTMAGFVESTLNAVVNALKFTVGEGDKGTVSGFFKDLWNGVVDLATSVAKKVLDTITAPVVNIIKSISVALATATAVLTYLKPWQIFVSTDPDPARLGIDTEVFTSTAFAKVSTGFDEDFSPELRSCADLAGIGLPKVTAGGSAITWSVIEQDPGDLLTITGQDATVPDAGSAEMQFRTGQETTEQSKGPERKGMVRIRVEIDNQPLRDFQQTIAQQLFQVLPSFVNDVLAPALGPIMNDLISKLTDYAETRKTHQFTVIYHDDPEPTPTPKEDAPTEAPIDTDDDDSCFVGTWEVTDMADVVAGVASANGGGGAITYLDSTGRSQVRFDGDGKYKWVWSNYQFSGSSVVDGAGLVVVKITFNGSISGGYTDQGGSLVIQSADNSLEILGQAFLNDAYLGDIPIDVTAWVRAGQSLAYTCGGDTMMLAPNDANGAAYELSRIE